MSTAQALQSILGSLAVILALIVQTYLARRFGTANAQKIEEKLDTVHSVVNGNHEAALARIDQLTDALTASSVDVPPHPEPPPAQPAPEAV